MTIPIPLQRTKGDVIEELCVKCLRYTPLLKPKCKVCGGDRIPYESETFLAKRIEYLKQMGYLDSNGAEAKIGIGASIGTSTTKDDIEAMFTEHLSYFTDYIADARLIDTFSISNTWHETAALKMLGFFPFPKRTFEEFANYKNVETSNVTERLKSIWLLCPDDQLKWMSRIAMLKLGASPETDFFSKIITDHVKLVTHREDETGVYKFDDDLINEFVFTLFHPSVLAHPNLERLLKNIDKRRLALVLSGYKCTDERLKPWVQLALHFCGAAPADPSATGDIAISQKIIAGEPIEESTSLALIDRMPPGRQLELLGPLANEEFVEALSNIKASKLWPLITEIHSRAKSAPEASKLKSKLDDALDSAISTAPADRIPELLTLFAELRDAALFKALIWRLEAVSDSQWFTLIPLFREMPDVMEIFMSAPSVRNFRLGLDLEPLLADVRLRRWALEFMKKGLVTHERAMESMIRFFVDSARSLDPETRELATWALPLKAATPKIFDANTISRLVEITSESPFDEDSRLGDWLMTNEDSLSAASAALQNADRLAIFDNVVKRFTRMKRHRRFYAKFLWELSLTPGDLASRADLVRHLRVGENVDVTYWLDRMLESLPKSSLASDAVNAENQRSSDEAKRMLDEAKRAAESAKVEAENARKQLEQMKFQNELLNLQMWLQREIASCQMNGTLSHESKAARFNEIQKEYEAKVAKLVETQTKG